MIVPNSTAGMIIGKGGSTIQLIKEQSGAFIQLSQKPTDTTLPERVVTVIGEDENNKVALDMILDKVQEDPQSGSCLNVSYSEINGPVANANPTGSPFANGQTQPGSGSSGSPPPGLLPPALTHDPSPDHPPPPPPTSTGVNLTVPGYSTLNIKLNFQSPQPPSDPRLVSQCLPHLNHSLRRSGYSEKVADEVTRAMGTLSLHGVLQMTPTNPDLTAVATVTDSVFLPPPPQTPPVNTAAAQGPFGPAGLVPASTGRPTSPLPLSQPLSQLSLPPHPSLPSLPSLPSHPIQNNNSFGLATAGNPLPPPPPPPGLDSDQLAKVDIEVSESLIGAVLGPAGKSIIEIQQFSGANIQISKKGMYSPGTRNRVVTVTGSQKAITTAKFLIDLKVQDEEAKRQFNAGAAAM